MKDKILEWFANGERGISSEAMAFAVLGIKRNDFLANTNNHPFDAGDFIRCVKFLDAVPEAREHLDKVAALSIQWARIVSGWGDLEKTSRDQEFAKGIPNYGMLNKKMISLVC